MGGRDHEGLKPLPQPTDGAVEISDLAIAAISDALSAMGIPGGALISKAVEIYRNKRIEDARSILFAEIARGNISLLKSPDTAWLIPNIFSYFDAAQHGEANHNLKILAGLLAQEIESDTQNSGKIADASRRLQGLAGSDLKMLSLVKKAFDRKKTAKDYSAHYHFIEDRDIVALMERQYSAPEKEINSTLVDFVSRGLLYIDGDPKRIGAHCYYKTIALDEILKQTEKLT